MAIYVVHDKSGRILQHGTANAQDIKLVYVAEGHALVLVDRVPNPAYDSIVDGLLVNIALPEPPKSGYEIMTAALTLLAKSDWTQLPDVDMTDQRRAAWRTYRQALRDILNNTDPATPVTQHYVWPTQPA